MFFSIIIGILILGFLIFIHEAGHFLAAKFFKVKVEEFGFGFPIPGRIWGFKKGETLYSINWLPAGGFVKLFGEESGSESGPRSFSAKPVWVRIIIAGAGVVINVLFAIILFTILLSTAGFKEHFVLRIDNQFPFGEQTNYGIVKYIVPETPADEVGLKFNDKIISINGKAYSDADEIRNLIRDSAGSEILLVVENLADSSRREVTVTPRKDPPEGEGALGIALEQGATVQYKSPLEKVFVGVLHSGNMMQFQWVGMKTLFGESVEQRSVEPIASQSSGPIGIVALFGYIIEGGGAEAIRGMLTITALISLLLGIFNLLPIPAADGGRLFFFYIEALFRKKVSANIENRIHAVGFIVLIVLFVLIAFNDVFKILNGRLFG